MNRLPAPLLVVTDRHQTRRPLESVIETALVAGARWIWLRERDLEPANRRALALRLRELTRKFEACLTIGADFALAGEAAADGVQLPAEADVAAARRHLGQAALIGVSAHRFADVEAAAGGGADYVTLSPVFPSASKPGYGPALGVGALDEAARYAIPVVALGGVTTGNAAACLEAGAAGVALMGEIMRACEPSVVVREILGAVGSSRPRCRDMPTATALSPGVPRPGR